jgi:hypothetical protein
MATGHPTLRFVLEYCDELGTIAGRITYVEGRETGHESVSPSDLAWIEWEDDDEAEQS